MKRSQLDLSGDYQRNVALYPKLQEYLRTRRPPLLAVWGNNDPLFLPAPVSVGNPYTLGNNVIRHSRKLVHR